MRALCAVVGRWCLPLVAAVAVTVAVSPARTDQIANVTSAGDRIIPSDRCDGQFGHGAVKVQ